MKNDEAPKQRKVRVEMREGKRYLFGVTFQNEKSWMVSLTTLDGRRDLTVDGSRCEFR